VLPVHIALWLSIIVYFISITIISVMLEEFPHDYFVFEVTTGTITFWMVLVIGLSMALLWDTTYK
jgi:hypothetical protein